MVVLLSDKVIESELEGEEAKNKEYDKNKIRELKEEIEEEINNSEEWELKKEKIAELEDYLDEYIDIELEIESDQKTKTIKDNFVDEIYGVGASRRLVKQLRKGLGKIYDELAHLDHLLNNPIYDSRDKVSDNHESLLTVENYWDLANSVMKILVLTDGLAKHQRNQTEIEAGKDKIAEITNSSRDGVEDILRGRVKVKECKIKDLKDNLNQKIADVAMKDIDNLFAQKFSSKAVAEVSNRTGNLALQILSDFITRSNNLDLLRALLDRKFQADIKRLEDKIEIDTEELREIKTEVSIGEELKLYDTGFRAVAFKKGNNIVITYRGDDEVKEQKEIFPAGINRLKIFYNKVQREVDKKDINIRVTGYEKGAELGFINTMINNEQERATFFMNDPYGLSGNLNFTPHDIDKKYTPSTKMIVYAEGKKASAEIVEMAMMLIVANKIVPLMKRLYPLVNFAKQKLLSNFTIYWLVHNDLIQFLVNCYKISGQIIGVVSTLATNYARTLGTALFGEGFIISLSLAVELFIITAILVLFWAIWEWWQKEKHKDKLDDFYKTLQDKGLIKKQKNRIKGYITEKYCQSPYIKLETEAGEEIKVKKADALFIIYHQLGLKRGQYQDDFQINDNNYDVMYQRQRKRAKSRIERALNSANYDLSTKMLSQITRNYNGFEVDAETSLDKILSILEEGKLEKEITESEVEKEIIVKEKRYKEKKALQLVKGYFADIKKDRKIIAEKTRLEEEMQEKLLKYQTAIMVTNYKEELILVQDERYYEIEGVYREEGILAPDQCRSLVGKSKRKVNKGQVIKGVMDILSKVQQNYLVSTKKELVEYVFFDTKEKTIKRSNDILAAVENMEREERADNISLNLNELAFMPYIKRDGNIDSQEPRLRDEYIAAVFKSMLQKYKEKKKYHGYRSLITFDNGLRTIKYGLEDYKHKYWHDFVNAVDDFFNLEVDIDEELADIMQRVQYREMRRSTEPENYGEIETEVYFNHYQEVLDKIRENPQHLEEYYQIEEISSYEKDRVVGHPSFKDATHIITIRSDYEKKLEYKYNPEDEIIGGDLKLYVRVEEETEDQIVADPVEEVTIEPTAKRPVFNEVAAVIEDRANNPGNREEKELIVGLDKNSSIKEINQAAGIVISEARRKRKPIIAESLEDYLCCMYTQKRVDDEKLRTLDAVKTAEAELQLEINRQLIWDLNRILSATHRFRPYERKNFSFRKKRLVHPVSRTIEEFINPSTKSILRVKADFELKKILNRRRLSLHGKLTYSWENDYRWRVGRKKLLAGYGFIDDYLFKRLADKREARPYRMYSDWNYYLEDEISLLKKRVDSLRTWLWSDFSIYTYI